MKLKIWKEISTERSALVIRRNKFKMNSTELDKFFSTIFSWWKTKNFLFFAFEDLRNEKNRRIDLEQEIEKLKSSSRSNHHKIDSSGGQRPSTPDSIPQRRSPIPKPDKKPKHQEDRVEIYLPEYCPNLIKTLNKQPKYLAQHHDDAVNQFNEELKQLPDAKALMVRMNNSFFICR